MMKSWRRWQDELPLRPITNARSYARARVVQQKLLSGEREDGEELYLQCLSLLIGSYEVDVEILAAG